MNNIYFAACLIAILSLVNATIIITFQGWGVFDWYITYRPKWLKWLKHCYFCYGFRFALIECIVIAFFIPSWHLLYIPFACTSLTSLFTLEK